ncbi:bifunctional sterol desaturase/short chain dehydrogenase [Chamaesiphon sp. OTE_75_metabat_556]|uniref:bifunctional sterol desaturase/short chain dehydrogenase n=1 Tax=Chamaesiphon sp. OTE_75_metabat_556 TaxID=2964692 RepID=UPI00286A5281|nr:bifunctional sterol desaturase/short chain dehydrogenase [Chamaesiphon sp. OTE_75_metabat_556]
MQFILGLCSILFAEVVRDLYHIAGHYWQPIKQFHLLHHKAYRKDFSIANMEVYQKAQLYNDVPEALCMVSLSASIAWLTQNPWMWMGCVYSVAFLIPAALRSQGMLMFTDFSHEPGDLVGIPAQWRVNRTYHWRHHFDETNAYYAGHFTSVDRIIGTSLSLKGKVVAVTGASGALGRELVRELSGQGAKVIAITTNPSPIFDRDVQVLTWQLGAESELLDRLQSIDILIVNHGVNVYGDRSGAAVSKSFEINTFSIIRLTELFLSTVTASSDRATKELWINTSEAEVNPAFSPLYELSKRTLGDLVTLQRLDAPCIIRKLVLGPFKSQLNPYGVMSARWVARSIIFLAKRDFRNIIITINPLTYLFFPIKESCQSLYFRLFTKRNKIAADS